MGKGAFFWLVGVMDVYDTPHSDGRLSSLCLSSRYFSFSSLLVRGVVIWRSCLLSFVRLKRWVGILFRFFGIRHVSIFVFFLGEGEREGNGRAIPSFTE